MANKPHKHAALIKAWADGAEIEYLSLNGLQWHRCDMPSWHILSIFRIKPEPKPDVMRQYFFLQRQLEWFSGCGSEGNNIKCMFDGETGKLKSVEIVS